MTWLLLWPNGENPVYSKVLSGVRKMFLRKPKEFYSYKSITINKKMSLFVVFSIFYSMKSLKTGSTY